MKKEDLKRYDKFKKNNLPTPFWDEERNVLEYVWFDKDGLNVSSNICYGLENISCTELYYSFSVGPIGHMHDHSFENVVRILYDYPKTFKINKDEEQFYSKQELTYLKRIQEYLISIGLDDVDPSKKVSINRYRNKKIG